MLFFKANEIERDSKKWAILLSSFGAETYNVVKSLAIPMKPAEKSFKEIVEKKFAKRAPNTWAKQNYWKI